MVPPGWVVKRELWKVVVLVLRGDGGRKTVAAEEGQRSDQVLDKDRRGQEPLLLMGVIASEEFDSDAVSDVVAIVIAIEGGLCSLLHRASVSLEICTPMKEELGPQEGLSWRMTGRMNMVVGAGQTHTSMKGCPPIHSLHLDRLTWRMDSFSDTQNRSLDPFSTNLSTVMRSYNRTVSI